jgi:hypothetical protein
MAPQYESVLKPATRVETIADVGGNCESFALPEGRYRGRRSQRLPANLQLARHVHSRQSTNQRAERREHSIGCSPHRRGGLRHAKQKPLSWRP